MQEGWMMEREEVSGVTDASDTTDGVRQKCVERALELLQDGLVTSVLGWRRGELPYDRTPAFFTDGEDLRANFLYDGFCGANLSKYLVKALAGGKEGRVLVFLKPCDTYSLNQLLTEHRIPREKVFAAAVPCHGTVDMDKAKALGTSGVTSVEDRGKTLRFWTLYDECPMEIQKKDALLERCLVCRRRRPVIFDEKIGPWDEEALLAEEKEAGERFATVAVLEQKTAEERFAFWREELSRCIRCNACRNVCPACTCEQCVFDNPASGVSAKASADRFEEQLYHIIRAFHVAGRCTDCGECSRVCPEKIPLHLLNRKLIKEMNELYGAYQAGAEVGSISPLTAYTMDDPEPSVVRERGKA